MTVTDARPQENTTQYPLDTVISDLEGILGLLREAADNTDGPLALRLRAALVREAAGELEGLPVPLHQEALDCDAGAAATEATAAAREALDSASTAVEAAREAYDATADPELAVARKAVTARQLHEEAADALTRAEQDGAEPAVLAGLHGRMRDAEAVAGHEARKLAGAQADRQSAREALDRARAEHRKAQDDLAAAEAAAEHPDPASLSLADLAMALMFGWQRLLFSGKPLTDRELAVCRYHATKICDDFGWTPPGARKRMERDMGHEMIAEVRRGRAVEISDGKGTVRLVAGPLGMAANQLATVALSR